MDSTNDPVYEVLSQIRDAVERSGGIAGRARPPLPSGVGAGVESPLAPAPPGQAGREEKFQAIAPEGINTVRTLV